MIVMAIWTAAETALLLACLAALDFDDWRKEPRIVGNFWRGALIGALIVLPFWVLLMWWLL